jgi:hypothetical protein
MKMWELPKPTTSYTAVTIVFMFMLVLLTKAVWQRWTSPINVVLVFGGAGLCYAAFLKLHWQLKKLGASDEILQTVGYTAMLVFAGLAVVVAVMFNKR